MNKSLTKILSLIIFAMCFMFYNAGAMASSHDMTNHDFAVNSDTDPNIDTSTFKKTNTNIAGMTNMAFTGTGDTHSAAEGTGGYIAYSTNVSTFAITAMNNYNNYSKRLQSGIGNQ